MPRASRIAATAAIGALSLVDAREAAAFSTGGHLVIEAVAYREMVLSRDERRRDDGAPDGVAVLRELIRSGMLAPPTCFEGDKAWREECQYALKMDPLAWWPIPGTDRPDLAFSRQFSSFGQCFHFMASPDDESDDHYGNAHVSYGVIWDAYARCISNLESLLKSVITDPKKSRDSDFGLYELMHSVADSYSLAHVERDYQNTAPGGRDPLIRYLKVYQPAVSNPFGRASLLTRHQIFEERDDDFYLRFAVSGGRLCSSYVHAPYAFPADCLSREGRLAVNALRDLLRTVHSVYVQETSSGNSYGALNKSRWKAFLSRHFAHTGDPGRLPTRPPPSPELERIPVLFGGTRLAHRFDDGATDLGMDVRYLLSSGDFRPFVLGLSVEGGLRRLPTQTLGVPFFRNSVDLMLPIGNDVGFGLTPFSLTYLAPHNHSAALEVDTRLARLDWFEPFHLRHTWLSIYGPLQYAWATSEFQFSAGLSFGAVLAEQHPGPLDLASLHPKRSHQASDTGPGWHPPEPWDAEVRSRAGPSVLGAFFGATSAHGRLSAGSGARLQQGIEWMFLKRNAWEQLNSISYSIFLEDAVELTTGNTPHTSLGLYGTARWYLLSPLGAIVTAGADSPDLSSAHTHPASARGRFGMVLTLNGIDIIVESPTLSSRNAGFVPSESFSARIAAELIYLGER